MANEGVFITKEKFEDVFEKTLQSDSLMNFIFHSPWMLISFVLFELKLSRNLFKENNVNKEIHVGDLVKIVDAGLIYETFHYNEITGKYIPDHSSQPIIEKDATYKVSNISKDDCGFNESIILVKIQNLESGKAYLINIKGLEKVEEK